MLKKIGGMEKSYGGERLKISRRKTEHLQYNKEGDGCIRLQDQELN